jgi:DNA-binding Lrp family transcriptional regulator
MSDRLDDIDKRILYHLAREARDVSATVIAEEVNVSPGTIRNRIQQLEDRGIIQGYHASIDYERAGRRLTTLLVCTSDVPERERLARQVADIPGVISVRELMTGRGNLHVTAVGENMAELSAVSRDIADLGIEIEGEDLIQREYYGPYDDFGPEAGRERRSITDFMSLSGSAEVVTLAVAAAAEIVGLTLREANQRGIVESDVLIISLERDDSMLIPNGDMVIRPDDLVTLFSRSNIDDETLAVFSGQSP